jgi:inner membrane protein
MPTIFTHALVGGGVAILAGFGHSPGLVLTSMILGVLPDVDVIGFSFGIPYASFFGHRGFSHSICCALAVSGAVAGLAAAMTPLAWWWLWLVFFLAMMSHAALDGFTNGGCGMAYFAPFDNRRYFFPWRPIQVSYIGLQGLRHGFGRVLWSEIRWVWLPLGVLVGLRLLWPAIGS